MNCQECELKLARNEDEDASDHLASCFECRALAQELRLNAVALREMRVRPVTMSWRWALAAAAGILLAIGFWKSKPLPKTNELRIAALIPPAPVESTVVSEIRPVVRPKHMMPKTSNVHQGRMNELRVKMFTSDPDVVIYWIVDRKEGTE